MKAKYSYQLLFIGALAAGSGCMVGKKYSKPEAPVAITYREPASTDTAALIKWFELYQDTVLQNIIHATIDSNRDLLTAAARIEEARMQSAIIKANLYPQLNYTASAGGGHAGTDAQKVAAGIQGSSFNVFAVLDWELDIWGRLRHNSRAAVAQFLSEVHNRNALQVSLIAEVASQYFLLRDLDNRLEIAHQTLVGRKENTRIISDRFSKGYVAEIDKLQALQQEYVVAATIPALQRQIVTIENTIRLLMGMGPGTVPRGYSNFNQVVSPDIPVGLPSTLLERRPDIMAAEKSVQAAFERVGAAQANRLPSLSMTGILGFASPQLSTFISSSGFVANGFGDIAGPLFNFGQRKNAVLAQRQQLNQVYYQYQKTVLGAFGDVDNALTFYRTFNEEFDLRKAQVEAAQKALILSNARYNNGYTSYVEVILMQDNLFDAQFAESQALSGKLTAVVQLYKALGGGWQ
ncbi:efflux transporter outer membrane subunit [Taibaiella soli]|uniref:Transporter n=1 Tax=Taibaiella soli TaxID=1649169 RepID=A0A2W2B7A8_9BACT|nr:efflux transporter outer membrane subunit [Taibaiella soli]PZF71897.1 transporter [Taibaiella soli]